MNTYAPQRFVAGDTVQFTKALSDYLPADGWTLVYTWTNENYTFKATGSDDGDGKYLVVLAAADTAGIDGGEFRYHAVVTKAAERYTVEMGTTIVDPDLSGVTAPRDTRTFEEKCLEALELAMLNRAGTEQVSYAVAGVSFSYSTLAEMQQARDRLRSEVIRQKREERANRGEGHAGNIGVML